jgi:hypothetical protein
VVAEAVLTSSMAFARPQDHRASSRVFAVVPRSYLAFMVAGWVGQREFKPLGVVRVVTGSSNWLLTPDRYQRLPREERPRPPVGSIDGRLDDARWHGMRRCWWVAYADGARAVRILPTIGPPDGVGVVTGIIATVDGEWVEVAAEAITTPEPAPASPRRPSERDETSEQRTR